MTEPCHNDIITLVDVALSKGYQEQQASSIAVQLSPSLQVASHQLEGLQTVPKTPMFLS
jgi:hypothetical protein